MYHIPTILAIALLMLAGPALTGTSALEAQTCPPSVCSGPPPSRGPFGVQAVVNGTTVTLSWELPPGTNIFLEVFIRQGPRIFAGWVGAVSSVTGTLPPGLYSFTISTDGLSRLAGADFTVEGSAPGVPPGIPGMPTVTLSGQFVTLNWAAPVSGGPVIDYQLEAGSAPGASNIDIVRTVAPTLSATAPPGIYYVRVRARNAAGLGPASPEVVIDVTGGGAPGVPGMPTVTLSGQFVTLNWAAPVSGGPVIDYQLEAGSAPGASNIDILRTVAPTLSATAPPGIYYVRVRGRNAAGLGPASPEVVIDVTAPSGPWRPCSTAVPSIVSLVPVPVEFVNTSSQPRKLYWIDFAGTRQSYGVLAPGQSGFITSFITHSWVVTDLAETCLGTLVISGGGRIATP
jgi:hypothetical protein